jgi:outer membrane protein assembly factor BamB
MLAIGTGAMLGAAQEQQEKNKPTTAARTADGKKAGDWPMWGGSPDRNMVSDETGIADDWDVKSGKNVRWVGQLGSQSYGNPVIVDSRVYIGTNNNAHHNAKITGDKGVMMCFRASDGEFLWQAVHDKLEAGRVNDWPEQGICSSPAVVGDRLYYVSNRCELVCADVQGFLDDENDGPYADEKYKDKIDGDFVWVLDMMEELGVFPHNLATSSPVVVGDIVYIVTGNGVDEAHLDLPMSMAPSFIAVDRNTGKVLWEKDDPGRNILHGQWSCPAYAEVAGKPQVVFPGGDGWVYSYEPRTGELIWKFDCNPKESLWELGGRGTRNNLIATPVIHDDKVYIGVGQDPEHGEAPGHFYCIDATKTGDITESGKVWHVGGNDFNRTLSTAAIRDGLVYVADLSGFLYCFDAKTGQKKWRHDLLAAVWGSPYVVDGRVYIGDEDGDMAILAAGPEKKLIREINMGDAVYTTPVASHGTLYIVTRSKLYAIGQKPGGEQ